MKTKWIVLIVAVLLAFPAGSNAWASRDPLGGGTWIDRDPMVSVNLYHQAEMQLGVNLYSYVNNNPVNAIDPFGLAPLYTYWFGPHPVFVTTDPDTGDSVTFQYGPANRFFPAGPGKYFEQRNFQSYVTPYLPCHKDDMSDNDTRDILKALKDAEKNPGNYNLFFNNSFEAPYRDLGLPHDPPPSQEDMQLRLNMMIL
jgi:RHS repeat-associated protein